MAARQGGRLRGDPRYAIRFANLGTWDAAYGYNVLAAGIQIDSPGALPRGFHPLTPCRVFDTRELGGGRAMLAGEERAYGVAGVCGVPAGASAVSLNVTVTQPAAAGNLQIRPAGVAPPLASTLNYGPGQTRANNAVAALSANGRLVVGCSQGAGSVHVVMDVNGYFQ